jgi:putative FmdB family regulatory protein
MIYIYKCEECEHTFELVVKLANRLVAIESPCPECGEVGCIEQVLGMPMSIDQHKLMCAKKPDSQFSERMEKIHKSTPGSTLNQGNYF